MNCELRELGYLEPQQPQDMPARGSAPPFPLTPVRRPDLFPPCIDWTLGQQHLPDDVVDLWKAYTGLSEEHRRRFLQAGSPYRRALSLGRDDQTLSLALMVVACEALKLPGPTYDGHNIYGVVKALLGEPCAKQLLGRGLQPQGTRNAHLHRGEFKAGEFLKLVFLSSYQDPSFAQGCRVLASVTPAAIIEWLKCGGTYFLLPRPFSVRARWGWKMIAALLTTATLLVTIGALLGLVLKG